MVGPPDIGGRIFYDDELQGFNFRQEKVPLKVALATLLKYADQDGPPTIYIGATSIDTYLPGLRADHLAMLAIADDFRHHPSPL